MPDSFEPDSFTADSFEPDEDTGAALKTAVKGAFHELTSPREIVKEFKTDIPPLQKFKQAVGEKLRGYAEKFVPSEKDIEGKAQKTGKVPYADIVEKTAADTGAHFISSTIPTTPMDLILMLGGAIALGPESGELKTLPKEEGLPNIKSPPEADMIQKKSMEKDAVQDLVSKVASPESKTPISEQIDRHTSVSTPVKQMGIPEAMVDSSAILRGTETNPALKLEILPGTSGWSWEVWNRVVKSAVEAVKKQGPSGVMLANDMSFVNDVPPVRFGMEFGAPFEKMIKAIPDNLREKAGTAIADALEGKPQKVVPQEMIGFIKDRLRKVAKEASALGVKIHRADGKVVPFAERENYYPRIIKTDILEDLVRDTKGRQQEMAQYLLKTKQAPTFNTALEQVKLFRKNLIDRKFGNLERARELDLPESFYERNAFKVLPRYFRIAYQRLAEVEVFGLNDVKALARIDNIAHSGGDADLALRTYRRFTGRDPLDQIAKGMFQALRNLSTGAQIQFQTTLYHIPRTLYPALEAGYRQALKAFVKSFTDAGELESRRMGINISHAMSEYLQEEYGQGRGITGKFANLTMTLEGIKPLDRFDRKYAAILGRDWIENKVVPGFLKSPQNAKFRGALGSLGIDPDTVLKKKGMSELEMNVAAKRFSDRTQGSPNVLSLPLWATSPAGKLYAQYKNFIFVLSREIAAIASRAVQTKDIATLTRLGTGLPAVGLGVYGIRHAFGMKDTHYVDNPEINRGINVMRDSFPMFIGLDVMFKILQGKRAIQDLLIPPSITNVTDVVGDIGESISKGEVSTSTKKDLARHIPLVGTWISHHIE